MTDSDRSRLVSHATAGSAAESTNYSVNSATHPQQNYGSIQANSDDFDSKTTLKFFEKVGFSLGHVYNDLCAGVWFSYTLLFMQNVLSMPGPEAGAMIMLGQIGNFL